MRGGKRANAGRPPSLPKDKRIKVGACVEKLRREEWEKAEEKAVKNATAVVREEWKAAQKIPVAERKAWIESQAGEDHFDNVRFALQEQQGIKDESQEPSRVIQTTPRRPKGALLGIYEKVANEFGITARMAERCHKEFRALQKFLTD